MNLETVVSAIAQELGPESFRVGPGGLSDGSVLVFWKYCRGEVCVTRRPGREGSEVEVVVNPGHCRKGCNMNCDCGERFLAGRSAEPLDTLGERVRAAMVRHEVGDG